MALTDIVVFIDPDGDDQLRLAASLARAHQARLTGIYIRSRSWPRTSYVRGQRAMQAMICSQLAIEGRGSVLSWRHFTGIAEQYKVQSRFRVLCDDSDAGETVVYNSLFADIVVIGQKAPHGLPDTCRPGRLLSATGVPLLAVPRGWCNQTTPNHIAIGWKASKEVRSAIAGAMPLMSRAETVTILVVDANEDQTGKDIVRHLERHGVHAEVEHVDSKGSAMEEVVLSGASSRGADLVVMGILSRTGPTRMIFGDTTRAVLKEATVPVLMSC